MAYYEKQKFVDGETVLFAAHLEYIEDGIVDAFSQIPRFGVKTIEMPASEWTGDNGIYSQAVAVDGVTENTKVDLLPSPEQLQDLLTSEISLTTANSEGSVTVFAIGTAPSSDLTMQALITEVVAE